MKDFIIGFFTNDNKAKINTSRVLSFMFLFALANKVFNLVEKIKELIDIKIFDKVTIISNILFEFVLVATVAISFLFILSLIIFVLVYKFSSNNKIYSVSKNTLELLLRTVLDFGGWGAVLTVFEYSFNYDYISSFISFFDIIFYTACVGSILEMIYDYYYFNTNLRFHNNNTTKIENSENPLKIEIIEKKESEIKTRRVR